jgi:alpha-L-rhamnosidase
LNTRSQPSWANMAEKGNGTYWEAFNADTKNLSLNHWTYSSIGEWLWTYVAGLKPDPEKPGYLHFYIGPNADNFIDSCNATYLSIRGPIHIDWKKGKESFLLNIVIPVGSTATISIPSTNFDHLTESGIGIKDISSIHFVKQEDNYTVVEASSGFYHFKETW